MRIGLKIMILACLLGSDGVAAPAESARIQLNYEIGFNGYFKLGSWTPLQVTLDNAGRETRGNLEVIVTSGSEYRGDVHRTIHTTAVELPPGTRKRYTFTVLIKSYSHELLIRLRQNDTVRLSRAINLRSRFIEKEFVIVADDFTMPDTLSMMPTLFHPANIRPQLLPETWHGYDSVELLIIGSGTLGQLRDSQFQALIRWLKQGGRMVLGTGLNYGSLTSPRTRRMLPITVNGHRKLTEITSMEQFCGRQMTGNRPFLVLSTRIDGARILAAENNIPIVAGKNIGLGETIFLAFDLNSPPFSRWEGRRLFWTRILSLRPEHIRPAIVLKDGRIAAALMAGMPLAAAKFSTIVGFAGAYLVMLWFILRKIRRPGKGRWRYGLSGLILILLFSFIAARGLNPAGSQNDFAYNSFCRLDLAGPDSPAEANFFVGLYSLERSVYGMKFGTELYPVQHVSPENSAERIPAPYAVNLTDTGQQITGTISRWSHILFKLKLHFDPPLTGYGRRNGSLLTLEVDSLLSHDLVDCLIYYNQTYSPVADIRAAGHQTVQVDLTTPRKDETFGEHQVDNLMRQFSGKGSNAYLGIAQQHMAPEFLREIHAKYQSRPDSAIIIGWLKYGWTQPEFDRPQAPPGSGITLVSWEIPVELTR